MSLSDRVIFLANTLQQAKMKTCGFLPDPVAGVALSVTCWWCGYPLFFSSSIAYVLTTAPPVIACVANSACAAGMTR